jgi:pSer/pThr/pTyr-binding forkhead associated (FHA) protein
MARIQIFLPGENLLSHDLAEDTIHIGRAADNDLQIDDPSISSHHAEIQFKDGAYFLKDLGSTNGTSVNEAAIETQELHEGDRIVFGHVDALFGEEVEADNAKSSGSSVELPSSEPAAASGISARPVDFVSSSPIPKIQSSKDPIRAAALALAVISILVSIAAIASAIVMIETPTFPTP